MHKCVLLHYVLQMRTSVRLVTLVLMLVITPWAPTTARVHEASRSQLMAGLARVYIQPTHQRYRHHRVRLSDFKRAGALSLALSSRRHRRVFAGGARVP